MNSATSLDEMSEDEKFKELVIFNSLLYGQDHSTAVGIVMTERAKRGKYPYTLEVLAYDEEKDIFTINQTNRLGQSKLQYIAPEKFIKFFFGVKTKFMNAYRFSKKNLVTQPVEKQGRQLLSATASNIRNNIRRSTEQIIHSNDIKLSTYREGPVAIIDIHIGDVICIRTQNSEYHYYVKEIFNQTRGRLLRTSCVFPKKITTDILIDQRNTRPPNFIIAHQPLFFSYSVGDGDNQKLLSGSTSLIKDVFVLPYSNGDYIYQLAAIRTPDTQTTSEEEKKLVNELVPVG